MITLIYFVSPEEKAAELEWLRDQKVYPAVEDTMNWKTGAKIVKFGAIVGPDAALAIKLRHKLEIQVEYKQR